MDNLESAPKAWDRLKALALAHQTRLLWVALFTAGHLTGWVAGRSSVPHPKPSVKAPVAAAQAKPAPKALAAKKAPAKTVAKAAPKAKPADAKTAKAAPKKKPAPAKTVVAGR